MSLVRLVARHLEENGPATLGELESLFPGKTKQQVSDALKNGKAKGLIHCAERIPHPSNQGWAGVWAFGEGKASQPMQSADSPRGEYAWIGPVSSVWDLSLRA